MPRCRWTAQAISSSRGKLTRIRSGGQLPDYGIYYRYFQYTPSINGYRTDVSQQANLTIPAARHLQACSPATN